MSAPFSGVNLRQQDRKLMRVPAVIVLPDGSGCDARTLNLSDEGMAIVAPFNPAPGSRLRVAFRLPVESMGKQVLELDAEVRNSVLSGADSGFRIGLQFVDMPASLRAAVKDYAK